MTEYLVIAYDISSDSTRRRVYRTLRRYGAWRQYSVFELKISKTDRVELEDRLSDIVEAEDGDRIRIYRLCESCEETAVTIGDTQVKEQTNVV